MIAWRRGKVLRLIRDEPDLQEIEVSYQSI
jgi:hypothetical protein